MVKKQKDDISSASATPNRDIIQRLNFLYQASVYLQSIPTTSGTKDLVIERSSENTVRRPKGKKSRRYRTKTSSDLARSYIDSLRLVAQKTTVKIDPSLKRSLCSRCNTTLVPGVSASVRVKGSACHGHQIVYACLSCKAARRIPAPLTSDESVPTSTGAYADTTQNLYGGSIQRQTKLHRKSPTNRALPLFARPDAGHVIFCGNEQLSQDELGCTPFV